VKPYKARGVALGMLNVFELAMSKVFAGEAYMRSYGVMWKIIVRCLIIGERLSVTDVGKGATYFTGSAVFRR
jgi:hypothetical protein